MILRRLVVQNFRQFKGRSTIDFALPSDHSVTVLLGENGSGKTTLLNAILWCLYGRIELENPDDILSYSAVAEAEVGSEIPLDVTLTFTHDDVRYLASRRATFLKMDGGNVVQQSAPELRLDQVPLSGEQTEVPDPKRAIERLLPNNLSRFFFFRGEDMELLALQASATKLKSGVEQFFDFTLLDRAVDHLGRVIKEYEEDIDDVAVGEVKDLTERIQVLVQDEREISDKIDQIIENIKSARRQRDEIDKRLEEIELTRPFLERKQVLDERIAMLEVERDERIASVKASISRDAFLFPLSDVLDVAEQLATGAVQRGELPARIKPAFVDDRLQLGECICGREMNESMRAHLVKWKEATGLADLEESVSECRSSIKDYRRRRDESLASFEQSRRRLSATELNLTQAVGERSRIESELEGKEFGIDDIKNLQHRRRTFGEDLTEMEVDKARKGDKRKEKIQEIEELNKRRKELAQGVARVGILQKRRDTADSVRKAIMTIRERRSALIREYLDKEFGQNWNRIAQLDRLVQIEEDFALSIKEKGGDGAWVTSAPSSANLKALSLCFVSALITLARELRSKSQDGRLKIFDGGDFPLVMDAPFAKMDTYFKSRVPHGLRQCVPQIVLLSSKDQWFGEVEEGLRSSVGRAYVLELHRPGESDESSTIEFGESNVDYVVVDSESGSDWSIARGI